MYPLFPYEQNTAKVSLTGTVVRKDEKTLLLTYDVINPRGALIHGPEREVVYESHALVRAHELWKDTCFELFWSEPGMDSYFECNVNVEGKWNIYTFDSYRNPKPPVEATQYRITKVTVGEGMIEAEIVCEETLPLTLECGLTAIVNTTEGEFFYATAHKGKEPDFHVRESFVVRE